MPKQAQQILSANPSLDQMQDVSNSIFKAAIKAEKINQAFFWAASKMATPIVNLKTNCSLKVSFLKIMSSGNMSARDAFRFIEAMEQSYALGAGNMSESLKKDVHTVLDVVRQKYPLPQGMAA